MMQPVEDAHDRTVRWRQLVDLLSRPHEEIDPALLDAALTMVRSGFRAVPKAVRAATARSIAGRAAEPRLVAVFAADKLEVAAPLLAAAPLDEEGWVIVLKAASKEVKAFVQSLRGEAPPAREEAVEPAPAAEPEEPAPSIGDIAARIERLKSRRDAETQPQTEAAITPAGLEHAAPIVGPNLFRWECDASGQIGWVEGAPRGALIGRSLPTEEGAPRELVRAFTDRLPFDDTPMRLPTPALEGEWRLSGIPAFSPSDGRFLGYRGIARREGVEAEPQPVRAPARAAAADAEALRETIHEIKTPLNAIIGFAEIIDGQYLGPAHRNYRHRAAEIVAQARTLLAAIEDLDFAARMQARAADGTASADLAVLLPPLAEEIGNKALSRDIRLRIVTSLGDLRCAIEPELGQRLLRRFIGAAVDATPNGQLVEVDVKQGRTQLSIALTRPVSTRHLSEAQMLDPSFVEDGEASRLGLGFALRLVRGLAKLAGGDLRLAPAELLLSLPSAP